MDTNEPPSPSLLNDNGLAQKRLTIMYQGQKLSNHHKHVVVALNVKPHLVRGTDRNQAFLRGADRRL